MERSENLLFFNCLVQFERFLPSSTENVFVFWTNEQLCVISTIALFPRPRNRFWLVFVAFRVRDLVGLLSIKSYRGVVGITRKVLPEVGSLWKTNCRNAVI